MKKKKIYLAIEKVTKFIAAQPEKIQAEYLNIIERLEVDGYLIKPFGKRLEQDLFEIRIRRGKNVRVFYFYYEDDYIFGVHAFIKKTQKTPLKHIKQAKKIISMIKRGMYDE